MSANALTAPVAKPADIVIKQEKTGRKEQVNATVFKDITRDPGFWKQATPS